MRKYLKPEINEQETESGMNAVNLYIGRNNLRNVTSLEVNLC
jgi:hypothetical protein